MLDMGRHKKPPQRSLLNSDWILLHRRCGNIIIEPFNENNLNTTSYDIRLGENYFQEQSFVNARKILNPFDQDDIKRLWGDSPRKATLAESWIEENGPLKNVRLEDKIIVLGPGETILTHTQEFVGGRRCINPEMRARSSVGRIGITVCKCAGWGDVGYCNRWTMEMSNHLKNISVVLVVGMRVAQIIFEQVDALDVSYATTGGQYQTSDDMEVVMRDWTPYMMLPKFSREKY